MLTPHPRKANAYTQNGQPVVVKAPHFNGDYLPFSVAEAVHLLGGLDRVIRPADRVLIKPNFNCSYALPLSTDLAFLAAAIELLQDAGARVIVGELSGRADWPTDKVVRNLNVMPVLQRYGVPFINFEYDQWLPMEIPGRFFKSIRVPRTIYEADKRVYLANMRCHSAGRFSGALKLGVGWIDLEDRDCLHADTATVELKVPEVHLGWQPDLVLMDGRRSTVAWHGRGDYVYPNLIMASGDMAAIDAQAVEILKGFPAKNRLDIPTAEMGQLKAAVELGLGQIESLVVEAEGRRATEQEGMLRDPALLKHAAEFKAS
ncbi:MAG: DUF362 domain-containing protein [Chloroflexi bacterium]|nr:DUF362 domain-containing protein [Chloroflexota bacterium]